MRRLLDVIGLGRQERDPNTRVIAHRYRVLASLGECGAAERFIAEDEAAEERVLLLLLPPSRASNRVAERLAQLDIAYGDLRILRPHDSGVDDDGRPFTVTRWVDGEPLSKVLERGIPSWSETFELLEDIADMMAVAHRRQLVHGALEPGRILIGKGGPWLLDFGLARALARPSKAGSWSLPGSPAYIAPELLDGKAPTPLSDLYSLAIILWELVAGTPPFTGPLSEIIDGHRRRPVPELVRRDAPPEVDALLNIALAKRPDDRFSDSLELIETLRGIEASSSGVWSLSSLAAESSGVGDPGLRLAATTDLGAMLRSFSVTELRATRELIDQLLEARGQRS